MDLTLLEYTLMKHVPGKVPKLHNLYSFSNSGWFVCLFFLTAQISDFSLSAAFHPDPDSHLPTFPAPHLFLFCLIVSLFIPHHNTTGVRDYSYNLASASFAVGCVNSVFILFRLFHYKLRDCKQDDMRIWWRHNKSSRPDICGYVSRGCVGCNTWGMISHMLLLRYICTETVRGGAAL